MGRLRSFDPDSVLDRAMHAFWARGFEATSIEDLVACTGINRASLYGAFGDKRDLFLKALQLYVQTGPIIELDPSTRKGGVRAALQAYIDQVLDLMSDGRNRGCFITNTVAEFGSQDADILAQTRIALAGVENAFDRLLRWGQQTGEVPAQADARARARLLLAAIQGLQVISKVNPDARALRQIADQAIAAALAPVS
ncbi:MAG: TetR family transcriptional regulator [Rhodospirillaceae bacterium]|jgi:TetR/AcrR family transcriptional repressor of nem operon|uniref:TetR/AcrR family transcriptional regulator n=1 Tax=Hwanghaeella sp. 1Z406 TaxID=3402811 RepID=UPI000C52DBE5|nr:TetR family transcriptional regulator [Rhodospirillales bacterium]MAX47663.1 TetR family transcriptional regulator [Rhodospirillaceae bacterium]|tara:strand:+ start:11585 stop:12175 length:591 start_codon:yes stop_codon:yes gene_type:complete